MINLRTILNKFRILLYNPIIVYLILIIGIGIVAIQSAIPLAKINYPNLPANYATKQLMFVSLGAFVAILVVIIGVDRIRALRWWIYGFWMIPLLGLFIYKKFHIPIPLVKEATNGAVSWYNLPGIGTIQPSEFMKIGIILVLADILEKAKYNTFKDELKTILKVLELCSLSLILFKRIMSDIHI